MEKELGGGALLDIGVYTLQFVLMVFNGERPESIHATGVLLNSGINLGTYCTCSTKYPVRAGQLTIYHKILLTGHVSQVLVKSTRDCGTWTMSLELGTTQGSD